MLFNHTKRENLKERLRRFFGGMPSRVQVAALPWRLTDDGLSEILLITSRDTGRWVLPKGWQENNEELYEAAAREASEEAGVTGSIRHEPLGVFYYNKKQTSGIAWRCQVHVYALEVDKLANKWPERKQRTRQWFPVTEAASLVREPDLSELILTFSQNPRESSALVAKST